jgi:hypothetical protein
MEVAVTAKEPNQMPEEYKVSRPAAPAAPPPSLIERMLGQTRLVPTPELEAVTAKYFKMLENVRRQSLLEFQAKVEEAWKACPDDGLEWLTGLREFLKKELEDADRPA